MKTLHTIQLNNCTETRTSKTHLYGACVVSTVTQQVVEVAAARLVALKQKVELLTPLVAKMTAEMGMTADEAKVVHEARMNPWFRAWHDVEEEMRTGRGKYAILSNADREKARLITVERGHVDPYTLPEAKLSEAAHDLRVAKKSIACYQMPKVGDQCVLAWSRDASLALKVLNSYHERAAQGYALTVRTDITTKQS